jgi:hypothetical protein
MESSLYGAEREVQRSSLRVETTANFLGLEDRAAAVYEVWQRFGVVGQDSLRGEAAGRNHAQGLAKLFSATKGGHCNVNISLDLSVSDKLVWFG